MALVLAVATAVRLIVWWVQSSYGMSRMPMLPLNDWSDFYQIYANWLYFVHRGLLPYRDFYTYKYPPLFLYTLYLPYSLGGLHAGAMPILVSDVGTALLVYLLALKMGNVRIALVAGMTYALSPFVLYEVDYLWLSSQPMTLFIMISLYLLKENRVSLSYLSLAAAVMFRQEAIFILPTYFLLSARENWARALKGLGVFAAFVLMVSAPFLLVAPVDYIYSLNYIPGVHFNLGPLEPALAAASQVIKGAPTTSLPPGAQGPAYASMLGILDRMASFLDPLLLLLIASVIYMARWSRPFLELVSAFSLLVFLAAYSGLAGTAYAYYFVPVYALIFASMNNSRTMLIGIATAVLCMVVPEGPFQVIPPALCLLFMGAAQGSRPGGSSPADGLQAPTSLDAKGTPTELCHKCARQESWPLQHSSVPDP